MDSAAAVRSHAVGRRLALCFRDGLWTTRGSLRRGGTQRTNRITRAAFFDGPYTSYRNTLSRVHCYLCLLGGGGLYAGLYHVAVLMTSVHTVENAATANTS